jgi:VanZ family protein
LTSARDRLSCIPAPLRPLAFWLPVIAWAAVIFALSATPNLRVAESDILDFVLRKAGHMAAFGILAVLVLGALSYSRVRGAVALSLALTIAYAASDEFHQSFTAGRHPSPVDVGIDTAGAVLALVGLAVFLRLRARRLLRDEPVA